MRRFVLAFMATACVIALAQDRVDVLRESNVEPTEAIIRFEADGGCLLQGGAIARYDSRLELRVISDPYAFGGARCVMIRDAAVRATKRQLGVGDGGLP